MKYFIVLLLVLYCGYYTNAVIGELIDVLGSITDLLLKNYDYVIVGGGSSGCILALRLSADSSNKVLLIESGSRSTGYFHGPDVIGTKGTLDGTTNTYTASRKLTKYEVPLYWQSASITGTKWNYAPSGIPKILGGSGTHNGMVFQRGVQADYNNWGVTDWSWTDVKPYFEKVEKILDSDLSGSGNHGHSGLIQVKEVGPFDSEGTNFLTSCDNAGLPFNSDFNSNTRDGCGYFQFNINSDGERSSPVQEYLETASTRSNLDILIDATVVKVNIEIELLTGNKVAKGVQFFRNNDPTTFYNAKATKEVILSAGALNSPKILLQSGIGNSTYLSGYSSRIPTVYSNLPGVGKNLQNHFLAFTVWNYTQCPIDRPTYYSTFTQDLVYSTTGTGILSTPGYSVGAWLRPNSSYADAENVMLVLPATIGSVTAFQAITLGISISNPAPNSHYLQLSASLGASLSAFYQSAPVISFTLLNQAADVDTLVRGIKESRRIMSYPPMSTLATPVVPDATIDTDLELATWLSTNTHPHDHWVGTAKMGYSNDTNAVVDNHLRVFGIKKLRVIDASIMPKLPHSLVHATVMMIAEKGADIVLADN
ncbi:choline dehydrogenase [Tieghemostelium lacteum]|uniref:Choline dehydrogenase n=1 Tax=Tieghemostelium lacteum TaxID=361077 RepID=A0A151ZAM8_TIELA|nr:choline dehydrogenase [Tieghemostelium lacteum]|eukprot:KYQ91000.1 choline dehydrogenase [Tieghemostelium lacteum]